MVALFHERSVASTMRRLRVALLEACPDPRGDRPRWFTMVASFHEREPGYDHAAPAPAAPLPEECPDPRRASELLDGPARFRMKGMLDTIWPIDFRPTDLSKYGGAHPGKTRQNIWFRIVDPMPGDDAVHQAVLAYLSDMTLLNTALAAHGRSIFDHTLQVASLDHALWFHRPFRADEWLLYAQDSPNASGGRALTRGQLFTRDGRLIASVSQEGLIRQRGAKI